MNLQQYKIVWLNIFAYYNREANEQALVMYSEDTAKLTLKELVDAFRSWRRSQTRFPMPADLIKLARPQIEISDSAKDLAMRVNKAVSKFGHMRGGEAKDWLGDQAWRIVEAFGGWGYLCENLGVSINVNSFIAQARDYAGAFQNIEQVERKSSQQIESKGRAQQLTEGLVAALNEKR